ncbi:CBS domain-containing protein [bacterium]|nr:CBS domain-containing protein [bacterium]
MSIAEWMTKDPVVTSADTPLEESLATMIRHRVRHLPILDEESFVGILSAPSLVSQLSGGEQIRAGLAGSATRDHALWVDPLSPDDDISTAVKSLEKATCLPVVSGNKLIGIFSHHNLMSYFMRHLAPQRVRRGGATPAPHRLDSLVNLVRRVSQADSPDTILHSVMAALRPLMPVDQAFILFQKGDTDQLSVAAAYLGPQAPGDVFTQMPVRDTLSGYVCLHHRSLRIEDLHQERRFPHSQDLWLNGAIHVPLRSVIAVPLMDQNVSFGVLQFWSIKPYSYLESDLELLELAGGYIASMIQRSWRLQKEQEANRIKDEFLAVVTHDLRNTIQGVMSYSQLLERKVVEPRLQSMARGIVESARHMSNLTNDLHDLARMGMQAMRVEPQTCQLLQAIEQVLEEFADFAIQEQVELRPPQIEPQLTCRADPVRLRQVLSNLVSNAVKYNRPQGWVQVEARALDDGVRITVEDSGIGIPAEEQASIFELFTRAANHRRRDSSGLGLAISKQLVELHGGTLELSSAKGEGSCFTVFLPDGR